MPFDPNAPYEVVGGFDPNQPYEVIDPNGGRTAGEVIKDTAIDAANGVVGLGESVVGVADVFTGNLAGKGLTYLGYDPKATKEILSGGYSEPRKAANRKVSDAKGFVGTLEALVDNPSVAFGSIVESAPMSLGAVAATRTVAVRMLGTALAENGIAAGSEAAKDFAVGFFKQPAVQSSLVRAGAVAEGAQTTGSIQEQARQAGRDWSDSVLPAVAAGAGTAAIGVGSSKIPGLHDAEATVATAGLTSREAGRGFVGATKDAAKEIGKSVVKEGALEEMPQSGWERANQNIAMGDPVGEGVPEDMAEGLIVGAAQGGGMVAMSEAAKAVQPARVLPIDKTKPSNLATVAQNISEADREHAEKEAIAQSVTPGPATGQPADLSAMKEIPEGAFTANGGKPFVSESALRANARVKGVDLSGHDVAKFGGGFVAVPKAGTVTESTERTDTGDDIPDWTENQDQAADASANPDSDENPDDAVIDPKTPLKQVEDEHGYAVSRAVSDARGANKPITLGQAVDAAKAASLTVDQQRAAAKQEKQEHGLSDHMTITLAYLRKNSVQAADMEKSQGKNKALSGLVEKGLARVGDDGSVEVVPVGGRPFSQKEEVAGAIDTSAIDAQEEARADAVFDQGGENNAATDNGTTQEGDERAVLPNAERHEVINNPDSIAHGHEVNTKPSGPQQKAENSKVAHVTVDGMRLSIENPAGTTRSGTDPGGKKWSIEMKHDYGRMFGTKGYDKDHVDVFVAPGYQGGAKDAYIVNQFKDSGKGDFDEHKVVMGAGSEKEALELYNANYEAGWKGGKYVTRMPMEEFKEWVKSDGPKAGALMRSHTQAAHSLQENPQQAQSVEAHGLATKPVEDHETAVDAPQDTLTLTAFEDAGRSPYEITRKQWVDMQRAERRRLGQSEQSGPNAAPYADYEEYHKQAVEEALGKGVSVSKEVLADYPGLSDHFPAATKMIEKATDKESLTVEADRPGGETATGVVSDGAPSPALVEHTTRKGKVLKGIVRTDLTQEQAKAIDPFTFKKDGGWFIREKHLKNLSQESVTSDGKKAEKGKNDEAKDIPKGKEGEMLAAGEVRLTATGRKTTPFPKIDTNNNRKTQNTLKRVQRWLMENALAEAEARGDDYNANMFRGNLDKPSQADRDSAEMYLFGDEQPKVVPSILKELYSPAKEKGAEQPDAIEREAARMEFTEIDGSTEFIVRTPHRNGGHTNLARFSVNNKGKPIQVRHFYESRATRDAVNLALKRFDVNSVKQQSTKKTTEERTNNDNSAHDGTATVKENLTVPQERPEGYGASNSFVTKDEYEKIKAQLLAKGKELRSGPDPELLYLGIRASAYHVEAGARTFAKYVKVMVEEFGDVFKPRLKQWYNALRDEPGFDNTGMDEYQAVAGADVEAVLNGDSANAMTADLKALSDIDEEIEHLYKLRECLQV